VSTLKRLVRYPLFLPLGAERDDVMGVLRMDRIGLAVTDYLVKRFGTDRERGEPECARESAARLGVHGWRRWGTGEQLFWRRWSPLVCALGGVDSWPAADRLRLARAIRAKGGPRESDAVPLLTDHRRFRRALLRLAAHP
jgi:hypothetical protein